MARVRRSVNTTLMVSALGPMDQLVRVLETLFASTSLHQFKVHAFTSKFKVELFVEQFQDVPQENKSWDKQTLLHVKLCLETGLKLWAERFDWGNLKGYPIQVWNLSPAGKRTSAGVKKRSSGICVRFFAAEEWDALAVDCIVWGMSSTLFQQQLLTASTSTLTSTVIAIEEYMAVGSPRNQYAGSSGRKETLDRWRK